MTDNIDNAEITKRISEIMEDYEVDPGRFNKSKIIESLQMLGSMTGNPLECSYNNGFDTYSFWNAWDDNKSYHYGNPVNSKLRPWLDMVGGDVKGGEMFMRTGQVIIPEKNLERLMLMIADGCTPAPKKSMLSSIGEKINPFKKPMDDSAYRRLADAATNEKIAQKYTSDDSGPGMG